MRPFSRSLAEDYLVEVMGAKLKERNGTTVTYTISEELDIGLRYNYPFKQDQPMYLGSIMWHREGHPSKLELLSNMSEEDVCRYIVRRSLELTF